VAEYKLTIKKSIFVGGVAQMVALLPSNVKNLAYIMGGQRSSPASTNYNAYV
jgi:hypothetical protein